MSVIIKYCCPCCGNYPSCLHETGIQTDCCPNPIRTTLLLTVGDQPSVPLTFIGVDPITGCWVWTATVPGCTFPDWTLTCCSGAWGLVGAQDDGTACNYVYGEGQGDVVVCDPFSFTRQPLTWSCCGGTVQALVTTP